MVSKAPLEIREYNPQLPSSGCLVLSWLPLADPGAEQAASPFRGKGIKITGLIELYRGKPEIRILSQNQITEE
jgi:hypothetical protein